MAVLCTRLAGSLISNNLVADGATLQMGIGNIPNAVLTGLTHHKNLGIHTEMFSDGVLPLIENGNITNALKNKHKGKIITGFCSGTQKLYDFIDDNPMVRIRRLSALDGWAMKALHALTLGLALT